MIPVAILLLVLLALMGAPLFAIILGAAAMGFYTQGIEMSVLHIDIYQLSNSVVLMALPLSLPMPFAMPLQMPMPMPIVQAPPLPVETPLVKGCEREQAQMMWSPLLQAGHLHVLSSQLCARLETTRKHPR